MKVFFNKYRALSLTYIQNFMAETKGRGKYIHVNEAMSRIARVIVRTRQSYYLVNKQLQFNRDKV